ncbi:MAG: sugar nucleotide-binding protein, partial [Paracoccaceae bacterium]
MKLLVFGTRGQVAPARMPAKCDGEWGPWARVQAAFSDPAQCAPAVAMTEAEAVITAVAYTAVDKAEEEEALALTV